MAVLTALLAMLVLATGLLLRPGNASLPPHHAPSVHAVDAAPDVPDTRGEHRRAPARKPRPTGSAQTVSGDAAALPWPGLAVARARTAGPCPAAASTAGPAHPDPALALHPGQAPPTA